MFTFWVTSVKLITFILTMSINHSETKNSTISLLNLTKLTASIGLKCRIGGQVEWCGGVPTSKISLFLTITSRLEVHVKVFLFYIITRNKSFKRNSPFSLKATIEIIANAPFCCGAQNLGGDFAAVFCFRTLLWSRWSVARTFPPVPSKTKSSRRCRMHRMKRNLAGK